MRLTHVDNVSMRSPRIIKQATHCKHGHAWVLDNIYHTRNGGRLCKQCQRNKKRNYVPKYNYIEVKPNG